MPRPCHRARLEAGLKLDINRLARRRFIRFGAATGPVGIRWIDSYGDVTDGLITAHMSEPEREGWFRIQTEWLDQRIFLIARPRHFGGHQWFFMCPSLNQRAMVLWLPPGARSFACRQSWGRRVGYASQFMTPDARAHYGQTKINARLCECGGFDPEQWNIPPKPKWMRWNTYKTAHAKFDHYDSILDARCLAAALSLMSARDLARLRRK
jgi:hypothetical protein